jgi:hypothetical protein
MSIPLKFYRHSRSKFCDKLLLAAFRNPRGANSPTPFPAKRVAAQIFRKI